MHDAEVQSFAARRSYASAALWIAILSMCLFVCLSVRPSIIHVHCDKTKEHIADIVILHEREITLVFLTKVVVGDVPSHLKFALKVTHLLI